MQGDVLELHSQELIQIANEMKRIADAMGSNLEASSNKVQSLINSYQGQAASAFLQNYNSNLKPQFNVICGNVVRVADFILKAVEDYEAQDRESAKEADNLSA